MKHVLLLVWVGIFLLLGAIIVGLKSLGNFEIWLKFADTVLLISIAISLLHLARKSL